MLRRLRSDPVSVSPAPPSGRGYFLGIGLNRLDPVHYGADGLLKGAEKDALDMEDFARREGFDSFRGNPLLSEEATRSSVSSCLSALASLAAPGDLVWIHYSGHGGQVPDDNGDEVDDDADETWCLYDGQFLDDELHAALSAFREGVRVLLVSDSCHSGTVARAAAAAAAVNLASRDFPDSLPAGVSGEVPTYRTLDPDRLRDVALRNAASYREIARRCRDARESLPLPADVLVLSACQDNQYALDGLFNGLFTGRLLESLRRSRSWKSYRTLMDAVRRSMPPTQTPALDVLGRGALADTRPFFLGGLDSVLASG